MNTEEWTRVKSAKTFTVFVRGIEKKDRVYLNSRQAAIYHKEEKLPDLQTFELNDIYGQYFQKYFQDKYRQENLQFRYVSPSSLGLIMPDSGEKKDDFQNWLQLSGIDMVITIDQEKLELDYSTRVPELSYFNFIYTLLLLDLWYIDLGSPWYFENQYSYNILFLFDTPKYSNHKSNKIRLYSSKFLLSQFTKANLELFIRESIDTSLKESFHEM